MCASLRRPDRHDHGEPCGGGPDHVAAKATTRLNVILRDVAAVGVQNVHVMHLTSKKGYSMELTPYCWRAKPFVALGNPEAALCSSKRADRGSEWWTWRG